MFSAKWKIGFSLFKTKWQYTSSSSQWDLVTSLRILVSIFRFWMFDRTVGFVKEDYIKKLTEGSWVKDGEQKAFFISGL